MDELSRKFRSIDWKGLQKSARKMQASTASALKDMVMTDLENKVRAATADTSWGASGSDLMQIAQGTYNREDYALIMSIVWQRLGSSRWRCVYKALEVLRHIIMHGAARCADEARAAAHHIQTLTHFRFVDPKTRRDCGEGVRTRAKLVCDMLADDAVLEEEREKSKELRAKLQGGTVVGPGGRLGGLSSDDYRYGFGGTGSGEGSSPGVTTTSTGGAVNFKGYGDDDEGAGGYDDAPTGMFAKRAAEGASAGVAANVPDLLGDDTAEVEANGEAHGFGEDDDDDFDPRAEGTGGAAGPRSAAATDDLFGTLDLGGHSTGDAAVPAHLAASDAASATATSGQMPTSLLIQNLAKQQSEQQQHQLQPVEQQPRDAFQQSQGVFGVTNPGSNSGVETDKEFGFSPNVNVNAPAPRNIVPSSGRPTVQSTKPLKPMVMSKPDKDPFGDLLDSAKKSGVF